MPAFGAKPEDAKTNPASAIGVKPEDAKQTSAAKPEETKAAAPAAPAPVAVEGGTPLTAPMPGLIINYKVNVGDTVKAGDVVVILEAMKMENALNAPCDGEVKAIGFASGDSVVKDAVLAVIG
jgi:oxaloacetate decarboxylase alpha subunit/pyruvate carboxylase subunit B